MTMPAPWHTLTPAETARQLRVDMVAGLNRAEVQRRLSQHGPNRLAEPRRRGLLRMLLGQFQDTMILVLVGAAVVSGLLSEWQDTLTILVIVLLNAIMGVVQEHRAERALQTLKQLSVPAVRVRRDGHALSLAAEQLVPGDLVMLQAGDLVQADLRLLEVSGLEVNEAVLTGAAIPVTKQAEALQDPALAIGERRNMAYRGTQITYGRASGLVVATGMATEFGHIAALLQQGEHPPTPLQQRLGQFGRRLAGIILAICALLFLIGLLSGEPPVLMFLTAVSLAVAAIPEALPAVVTIGLALGARKLVQQHALIRQLPAVETLGSVTVICSGKTGTLTENRMHVEAFVADGRLHQLDPPATTPAARQLFEALALNNDAQFDMQGRLLGSPTETALLNAAIAMGGDPKAQRLAMPRVAELPFDAGRKLMTTLHADGGGIRAYTKGAPEQLLARCRHQLQDAGLRPLATGDILQLAEGLASDGYHVLAVAWRDWDALPAPLDSTVVEQDLCLLGLVALMDPPRPEAREAVATCRSAGIKPLMITGDHPVTARAIAHRLGIADQDQPLLTGTALDSLSDQALQEAVAQTRVYARVTPQHKTRIVTALQRNGEYVAMTGEGVNDAPALRRADIGVAMGRVGTDVARESAHMVLLDDNFATIVAAVHEGRRVFDNIRKFIRYILTGNVGEILTVFLAPLLGMPMPLLPIHLLWVNLVTDGLPGLALSAEAAEPGIMRQPPRPPAEPILSRGMNWQFVWLGLLIGALSLGTQAGALAAHNPHWQTMVFMVLTFSQLFNAVVMRSQGVPLWRLGLFGNRFMNVALALTVALQLMVIYLPVLQPVFRTQPLSVAELALCIAVSALVVPAVEFEKWLVRRGWLYRSPSTRQDA
jgi:Ca2+-transporting ATPase